MRAQCRQKFVPVCGLLSGLIATLLTLAPASSARGQSPALAELLSGIVHMKTFINPDGRTTQNLGREREGSAIVIDNNGLILTIGYLMVEAQAAEVVTNDGHGVPALLGELMVKGRTSGAGRPWLGVNTDEQRGHLVVSSVTPQGPAEEAGLKRGDTILGVNGEPVNHLPDFYRKLYAQGGAGTVI